jgi:ATP-dependent Lon protease
MNTQGLPTTLKIIPITNTVIFPHMRSKCHLNGEIGDILNDQVKANMPFALALTVKEVNDSMAKPDDFYTTGTLVSIDSVQKADSGYVFQLHALRRITASTIVPTGEAFESDYSFAPYVKDLDAENQKSMVGFIMETIADIGSQFHGMGEYVRQLKEVEGLEEILALIMPFMQSPLAEKQELLKSASERQLGIHFIDMLISQKDSVDFQIEMAKKFHDKVNRSQREVFLREQLKAIQEELGENKGRAGAKKEYHELIEEAGMPEEVKEVALAQADKLKTLGGDNMEAGIVRNYLDLLVGLPWKPGKQKDLDIDKARAILDNDHYGIEEAKKRIIQHLAVMKLKKSAKGSILLFVGPPGTGKTSLGKSIATAMGRKYQRLSLGGIRDEAEIRGHRRTYIGALPGRIINGMKHAGEKNPVFVLDEVDKLMVGYSGDPASALLEVLDPEQNNTFTDHYLEVPYDLSEVMFIATANSTASIPGPLLDRMELIELTGYTLKEKFHIARRHLIPAVFEDTGLSEKDAVIDDDALYGVIADYTREAGVRGLKKELSKIGRGVSEKIVSGAGKQPYNISKDMLREILGKKKVWLDNASKTNPPGVMTGLAWTPVGGDILFVESSTMPGKGELILTGQLGDVMKESARISLSLIQTRMASLILGHSFTKNDFHIHVPSGAIPKDGPSAGITLFTSLASLLLKKPIDSKLAMTGEITLRGSVLPVGGIKEKALAAHRAGIARVILPEKNREDVLDIPEEVRKDLEFNFADTIEDVIKYALDITLLPQPYGGTKGGGKSKHETGKAEPVFRQR